MFLPLLCETSDLLIINVFRYFSRKYSTMSYLQYFITIRTWLIPLKLDSLTRYVPDSHTVIKEMTTGKGFADSECYDQIVSLEYSCIRYIFRYSSYYPDTNFLLRMLFIFLPLIHLLLEIERVAIITQT